MSSQFLPIDAAVLFLFPKSDKSYIHFVVGFPFAHVDKVQVSSQKDLRAGIIEISFNSEMADVIKLDFFFVVFYNEMLRHKPGSKLINARSLHNLVIVILLGLLIGMEVLSVSERVSVDGL